ncbi:MGMT family protein [Marinobacter salicampi]|uniref:MGMT family protein n=1 Tax=Marinobacter salicampi TaxID=435907 RepID=UPI001409AC29|nr:MGMT family protein [Marinobacter salicampi]
MAPSASSKNTVRDEPLPSGLPSRQEMIWQVVCAIPPGRVASYGQVAALAGLPGLARFTGRALGQLAEGSEVPWFRVIRSDGSLAFPPGSSRYELQTGLLRDERIEVVNGRVPRRYRWSP